MMGMIRSLIRRTIALLASAAVVVYSTLCFSVSAEESGYWKLVDQRETEKITNPERDGLSYTEEGSAAAGFHIRKVITEHAMRGPYSDSPGQKGHKDCSGEFGDQTITFSPLPPAQMQAGETISIHAHVTCSTSTHMLDPGGYAYIRLHWDLAANRFAYFSDENSAWDDKSIIKPLPEQRGDQAAHVGEFSGTFSAEMPAGNTDSHSKLYIVFGLNANLKSIESIYEYEWVDTSETEPVAAVTEETTTESTEWIEQTVNKDAEATDGTDSGAVIDPDIVTGKNNTAKKAAAGAVGAAIVGGAVASAVNGKKKKNNVIYKMIVSKDFGDTLYPGEHYQVYAQIVQVHTVTGQMRNADELSRKIETFSEQLPVKAYYNSALNMMTAEFDVNEDNSNTAVLSFRLKGKGGVFTENVKFKVENLEKRIEVMYINSDGSIGEILDRHSEPIAHGLFLGENLCSTVYLAVFGYHNPPDVTAVCETTDLKPTVTYLERFEYSRLIQTFARKYDRYGYLLYCKFYKVDLGNRTAKPTSMFGQYPKHTKVQFIASSKRGSTAGYSLPVALIPRGFFIDLSRADETQKSENYIDLYTNELVNQNRSELKSTPLPIYYGFMFEGEYRLFEGYNPNNRKIKVERIIFDNAEVNGDFIAKKPESEKIKMQKILEFKMLEVVSSQTGIAETGTAGWSYGWNRNSRLYRDRIPVFCPKMPVLQYQDSDEYLFDLEVCYETKNTDADSRLFAYDVHDTGTIPVRVYGEPAESPLHERHKELAKIDKIIRILDLEKTNAVKLLIEREKEIPTVDLHRLRRWIFDYGVEWQEFIFKEEMSKAAELSKKIVYLTGVKWACDTAFGMLLKIYCETRQPPLDSDLVDAIVSPLKTYLEEIAADASVAYFWDVPFDYMSLLDPSRFLRIMEDTLSKLMLKDADKADWKALVKVLVLASLVSALKKTVLEIKNEYDAQEAGQTPEVSLWWRIIRETMKDMTRRTLKIAVSKYLINGPLNFKPPMADQDVFEAVVGNLPDTDAFADSVLELARDLQITNGMEPYDVVLEKMAQRFGTMELTLANGSKVTVSKIKAILMYTDKFLEQWGAAKLKQFFEQPIQLPAQQPYIGWRDTEQILGKHGYDTSDIHWS